MLLIGLYNILIYFRKIANFTFCYARQKLIKNRYSGIEMKYQSKQYQAIKEKKIGILPNIFETEFDMIPRNVVRLI